MIKRNIPLKIWQTHKNNSFLTYSDNTKKLKELNNDCEYNFLNDNEIREYIKFNFNKNVLKAFDKIKPGAGRADIWRLAVILKEGGIYIDFDLKIKKNSKKFSQLIKPEDEMIHGRNWHIWGFKAPSTNAILCARPNHPIIKNAFYSVINSINNNKPLMNIGEHKGWMLLECYTGTPHLWKAISEHINRIDILEGQYKNGFKISNILVDNLQQCDRYHDFLHKNNFKYWMAEDVFNKSCVFTR